MIRVGIYGGSGYTGLEIIDRIDFNATTHGQRDIDDARLSNLIEAISAKRLGLTDVEGDIIGRSYEYLIRKFAEGGGQSAGEFYTPGEVGEIMALIMDPQPGMGIYDPTCGSAGLLIKCELALDGKMKAAGKKTYAPLKLYGQEQEGGTWAMANMNMIIHDMEGEIQIGDTFRNPKFRQGNRLQTFDRAVANPMWNQTEFKEKDYDADELDRFPKGAGFPGGKADWGWVQHILASLKPQGRAAVVLDTGAASRGSGNANTNKEKDVRRWFVEQDLIEGVIYLPENLFYNTTAPGIILVLNRAKPKERKETNSSCSTPAASSPRATRRTTSPRTPSAASPTPSARGRKWRNTRASSAARRLRRTISTSRPAATSTPAKRTNTGRSRRSWRSWTRWRRRTTTVKTRKRS